MPSSRVGFWQCDCWTVVEWGDYQLSLENNKTGPRSRSCILPFFSDDMSLWCITKRVDAGTKQADGLLRDITPRDSATGITAPVGAHSPPLCKYTEWMAWYDMILPLGGRVEPWNKPVWCLTVKSTSVINTHSLTLFYKTVRSLFMIISSFVGMLHWI